MTDLSREVASLKFEDEWKMYEAIGYQYGADALANVKFGWDIHMKASEKHLAQPEQTAAPAQDAPFPAGVQRIMDEATIAAKRAWPDRDAPSAGDAELKPVAWEYRHFEENTATPGWSKWQRLEPRNPRSDSLEERAQEIKDYIAQGYKYELRGLYLDPAARLQSLAGEVETLKGAIGFHQRALDRAEDRAEAAESEAAALRERLAGVEKK